MVGAFPKCNQNIVSIITTGRERKHVLYKIIRNGGVPSGYINFMHSKY